MDVVSCAENLRTALNYLVGKRCWAIIAGSGTGSSIHCFFGDKIPRAKPVSNPFLTEVASSFTGEYRLYVSDSAWRLDTQEAIVCCSTQDNAVDGPMLKGLDRLIDKKVESVEVYEPGLDLQILFSDGLTLRLFCDQCNAVDLYDNYSFFDSTQIFTVSTCSELNVEKLQRS